MRLFIPLVAVALATFAVAPFSDVPVEAQIPEMEGTWDLNPEKSIGPSPRAETLVFTIVPGEQRYTMDSVDESGEEGHVEWAGRYDGRDHPTASDPENATVSLKRLGEKTEFVTNKRNGRVTSTYTRVLADDDQTLISIGRNAEGVIQWVRVFERR